MRRIAVDEVESWLLGQFLINYCEGIRGKLISCSQKHHNCMFNNYDIASSNNDRAGAHFACAGNAFMVEC